MTKGFFSIILSMFVIRANISKGTVFKEMLISISLFMGQCFAIVRLNKMQTLKIIIKRLQIDYFSGHAKKS